ncbi:MAG: RnfH family protein [Proteobacteria bacterium]|nr:RnfH family protein [Pseudomonadota bacterium]
MHECLKISVYVLFVTESQEYSECLTVVSPVTIADILEISRTVSVAQEHLGSKSLSVGVWGKRVKSSTYAKDGDRIEIYRALIADPKELRRSGRLMGKRRER